MNFELFIVLILIFVFLLSCGGLIQKIRQSYDSRARVIVARVPVSRQTYDNRAYYEETTGVFPAGLCPPPYSERSEPPPKYEEVIKDRVVINVPPVAVHTAQFSNPNATNRDVGRV